MDSEEVPVADLTEYTSVGDWLDRHAGPFFETRSSLDWFIKNNRQELVEAGALIPREGRSGSIVSLEKFPKAVVDILRRRALARVAGKGVGSARGSESTDLAAAAGGGGAPT